MFTGYKHKERDIAEQETVVRQIKQRNELYCTERNRLRSMSSEGMNVKMRKIRYIRVNGQG
jgi:hypothetical protein